MPDNNTEQTVVETPVVIAEYTQAGDNIDYTAAEKIEYMQVVPLADRIGIALENIAAGDTGTVTLTGAFKLPAADGAIEVGAKVYFDAAAGKVTTTATDNIPAGYAIEPKTAAAASIVVRIG